MLQTDRRIDPYPFTWEIPAGILTAVLVAGSIGVQVGRGIANWLAGSRWTWPEGRRLFSSLPEVLGGSAIAGLTAPPVHPAQPNAVIGWVIVIDLILLAVLAVTAFYLLRRWGPGRMHGMASTVDAEASLGLSRLRRDRPIIRPDLYLPARRHRDRPST